MKMKKRKNNHGFSLAETLLAVMILSLVAGLLTSSLPTIITVYNKVTVGANAKIVLSTTVSSLRNELGTAKNIVLSKSDALASSTQERYDVITYYSMDTQATSKIYIGKPKRRKESGSSETVESFDRDSIILQEYAYTASDAITTGIDVTNLKDGALPRQLVPTTAATENLYITYEYVTVSTDGDMVIFHNLKVLKRDESDREYMSLEKLNVRVAFGPVAVKAGS